MANLKSLACLRQLSFAVQYRLLIQSNWIFALVHSFLNNGMDQLIAYNLTGSTSPSRE